MNFIRGVVENLQIGGKFGDLFKNEDPDHIDQEASLYKRDVLRLMTIFKEEKSEEEVIEALSSIGNAIYLGGSQSAKLGLSLLPRLVTIFRSHSTSTCLKIQALKTMSQICSQYKDYQNRVAELGGLTLILELATDSGHDDLSNWAFYCLTVLVASNVPLMRELLRMDDLSTRIHRSMHHYLKGQKRYAEELLLLLGLEVRDPLAQVRTRALSTA